MARPLRMGHSNKSRITGNPRRGPDSILTYIVATLSYISLGFIAFINTDGSGKAFGTLLVH